MNARLSDLISDAERLSSVDQDRLAEIIEGYVESRQASVALTAAEEAELHWRHAEAFDAAPAEDVDAFFKAARG